MTTTHRKTFELERFRCVDARVATWGGAVEIVDLGTVQQRLGSSQPWITVPLNSLPEDQQEWLREECRLRCFSHAAERAERILAENTISAYLTRQHATSCALRCDMGSINHCTCDGPREARERIADRAQGRAT